MDSTKQAKTAPLKKKWVSPDITILSYQLIGEIGHSGNPDGPLRTGGV